MNCNNCGSPIKEGIKFCGKCGAPIAPPVQKIVYEDPQEPIPVVKEKPKKKKKLFLIPIISALLTIAILLPTVILPYFSGKGDVKPFISSLSAGDGHSVAIKSDGTVYATGKYKDEMKNWTEIVALASSGDFTAGLRADGSVVLAGSSFDLPANEWNGITQIAVGDNHIVGLKKDGTVIATGDTSGGKCDEVKKWDGIVLVASNNSHTFGVKNDGTVVATGKPQGSGDVTDWKDIVSVSSNDEVTVGLKKNGTVVITDYDGDTDYDVSKWKNIVQVSAGENHIVALKEDGTVVATGDTSNNKTDVSDWENIKDVSAGGEHTIALKEDGTVIATGDNSQGQCEVEDWTDVRVPVIVEEKKEETTVKRISREGPFYNSLYAGWDYSYAIKNDGTVYATDSNEGKVKDWTNIVSLSCSSSLVVGLTSNGRVLLSDYNKVEGFVESEWKDIKEIASDSSRIIGVKKDGSVITAGSNIFGTLNIENWKDIVQVAMCEQHAVGVKKDGTVIAKGMNNGKVISVENWTDVDRVYTHIWTTVGLKKDGTVVATGNNRDGKCNVENWKDIIDISIGGDYIVGLKSDGTVVATGNIEGEACKVDGWKDIEDISAGTGHTIGLKSDGTVVVTGENEFGRCNVSNWTDVRIPGVKKDVKTEKTKDDTYLFYEYLKNNKTLSSIGYPKAAFTPADKGIVSALIEDFDNDSKKEMLVANMVEDENSNNKISLVFELYRIKNNVVTYCSSSEMFWTFMVGNSSKIICAEYVFGKIMIYASGCGYGGSCDLTEWISLVVSGDNLIKKHDFSEYNFYRYEQEEYKDNIAQKDYSSEEELMKAVKLAGFDYSKHEHYSAYETTEEYENAVGNMKGKHILVMGNEDWGQTHDCSYIYDNTNLRDKLSSVVN